MVAMSAQHFSMPIDSMGIHVDTASEATQSMGPCREAWYLQRLVRRLRLK